MYVYTPFVGSTHTLFWIVFIKIAVDLIVQSVEKLLYVGIGIRDADGSLLRATSRWEKMKMISLLRAPCYEQ
jgi:hypothetical protein